ncbi:hypothetical protein ACFL5T_01650 [Gemmatimonadota bacterium]
MSVKVNRRKIHGWAAGGLLSVAGGSYLAVRLRNGWFPWDEGSLAVTAERVLIGELPHRDFPDLYTGGLTFLNAAAFRVLGVDLLSPRIVLLLAFVAWLCVLYCLSLRFLPLWLSALVVALGVVWSVPNYPAAVPSWYNLFLATAGLFALVVFSDGGRMRWVWLAGICAGLSICAKVVGVFFAVAAGLFFLFYEQTSTEHEPARTAGKAYSALVVVISAGLVVILFQFISRAGGAAQVLRFVVPMGALVSVLVIEELRRSRAKSGFRSRLRSVFRPAIAFLMGMSIPLLILSLPYVLSGSVADLVDGVFIRPVSRLEYAAQPAPPILSIFPTLSVAGILSLGLTLRSPHRWFHYALVLSIGAVILVAARFTWGAYMFAWFSAYHLTPLVIVAGCIWVAFAAAPNRDRRRIFALLSITAGVGLVEFPYAKSIYFLYTAALVFLTLAALVWQIGAGRLQKVAIGIPWAYYFAFGLLLMNPQPPGGGGPHLANQRWAELALPRARLRSSPSDSLVYGELLKIIREHRDRKLGYAGPDAPEVYFLAGSRDRAPVLFDFLQDGPGSPLDDPGYLSGLDLIVLNLEPEFSPELPPATLERLATQFPHSAAAGPFEVRWRE